MDTAHEQRLTGSAAGNLFDPRFPLIVDRVDISRPHHIAAHAHRRGQLLYATQGTLQIHGSRNSYHLPTTTAVWIPPDVEHSVTAGAGVHYRSIFVEPQHIRHASTQIELLTISPLLALLIQEIADYHPSCHPSPAQRRLASVLLDQLDQLQPAPVHLPMPQHPRLRLLLVQKLNAAERLPDPMLLADSIAVSPRTLERLFRRETGFTYNQWRQHCYVLFAIEGLQQGKSIKQLSHQFGYQNPSAFIALFRRVTGTTPNQLRLHPPPHSRMTE